MSHHRHPEAFTGQAAAADARAALTDRAEGRLAASRTDAGTGQRPGPGGPLLITALAASGALAWGALGLGTGVLAAATVLVIRRRRSSRACCKPGMTGWARRKA
jgi:hypothetical protein